MVSSTSGVIKYETRVQKVIKKIKKRIFDFDDIQDRRIASVLKYAYVHKYAIIHPKMRVCDVEEIKLLSSFEQSD